MRDLWFQFALACPKWFIDHMAAICVVMMITEVACFAKLFYDEGKRYQKIMEEKAEKARKKEESIRNAAD